MASFLWGTELWVYLVGASQTFLSRRTRECFPPEPLPRDLGHLAAACSTQAISLTYGLTWKGFIFNKSIVAISFAIKENTNRKMAIQQYIHIHGITFGQLKRKNKCSLNKKKEILSRATTWMNIEDIMLNVIKRRILPQSTYRRKSQIHTDCKQDSGCQGRREEGLGSCLMGTELQFHKMKSALEICCRTVWMFLALLYYTFTHGSNGKFMLYVVYHN